MTIPARPIRPRPLVGRPAPSPSGEAGSVTPLVLGMAACLLLLGAGLTAATSAFLAQQRLRAVCDGAAIAGADAISGATVGPVPVAAGPAEDAVARYLGIRSPGIGATVELDAGTVTVTCRATADITFGGLFGSGRMDQQVVSVGSARL